MKVSSLTAPLHLLLRILVGQILINQWGTRILTSLHLLRILMAFSMASLCLLRNLVGQSLLNEKPGSL